MKSKILKIITAILIAIIITSISTTVVSARAVSGARGTVHSSTHSSSHSTTSKSSAKSTTSSSKTTTSKATGKTYTTSKNANGRTTVNHDTVKVRENQTNSNPHFYQSYSQERKFPLMNTIFATYMIYDIFHDKEEVSEQDIAKALEEKRIHRRRSKTNSR